MKYKDIIVLLASAFFIVAAWIIFNIYHNSVTSTTSEDLKMETLPLNPTFDKSTINMLSSRTEISPVYTISQSTPTASLENIPEITPEVTPEITLEPESTDSAQSASPGGTITP